MISHTDTTPAKGKPSKPPFLAFVTGAKDLETLREFAEKKLWGKDNVFEGNIGQAAEHLKSHPSPEFLVVEIPSAQEASELLNKLADVCDPDTKVVVSGNVNEYSFYCWLTEIGISSYLLNPLTEAALENAHAKATEPPPATVAQGRKPARIIGVTGTRGGVGATSVAICLASLLAAEAPKQKVALVDLDPQDGSVALLLDLEPARGLREALEKPDRIDNLFLDRVMHKTEAGVYVLSAEESLADFVHFHEHAAESILRELREKFDIVILDLPRQNNPFFRACARACEPVLVVSDLTLASLRDAIRIADLFRDNLKLKPPMFVANRVGMAAKYEIGTGDFEKGVKGKLEHSLPFAPDVFMTINGELDLKKQHAAPAVKALTRLAHALIPEAAPAAEGEPQEEKKALLGFLKKGK